MLRGGSSIHRDGTVSKEDRVFTTCPISRWVSIKVYIFSFLLRTKGVCTRFMFVNGLNTIDIVMCYDKCAAFACTSLYRCYAR